MSHSLLILMYHRLGFPPPTPPDTPSIKGLYTTPKQFESHLLTLKKQGYAFSTFEQLARSAPPEIAAKTVILTFDDGTADLHQHALPLLRRHQVPAVVFVIVNDLGRKQVTWSEAADQVPVDMLSWEQVDDMGSHGVEFGSHGMDHRHMSRLSAEECRWQLGESKRVLEERLNREVVALAYPYGDHSPQVVRVTQECGYRFAVTTEKGINLDLKQPFELKRVSVKGTKFYHPWKFNKMVRQYQ